MQNEREAVERVTCGVCGLPIHPSESGIRHFGFYVAHADYRCIELLKSRALAAEARVRVLREALASVVDDAGDAFIFSRMIHHTLSEDDLRAKQNEMADRINTARAALQQDQGHER